MNEYHSNKICPYLQTKNDWKQDKIEQQATAAACPEQKGPTLSAHMRWDKQTNLNLNPGDGAQ